ncbi:MAG: FlgD immunoglobulin-like domain containing protein [candidate division Zixibacteria bacterium]
MRCHEARKRIADLSQKLSSGSMDEDIKRHIQSCPECALFAQAERTISRDLDTVAAIDDNDGVSVANLRKRIESIAGMSQSEKPEEFKIMSAIKRQLRARPRLSISLGTVIILLLFTTLIPFKFDRTIGYEVAVAGVDKNLAMDEDKITELFVALGLGDVDYKVGDCEATCELTITDLKSEYEMQLIIETFDELGNCVIKEVKEISDGEMVSLLKHAKHIFFSEMHLQRMDEDGIHEEAVQKIEMLKGLHEGSFTIFISEGGDIDTPEDDNRIIWKGSTAEGVLYELDQNDPEFWEKLKATGDPHIEFNTKDDNAHSDHEAEMIFSHKPIDAALPDGFELKQNYPNPFNPTTTIQFSIPEAEDVLLEVYNINGQRVKTLVDKYFSAGQHSVTWDATNSNGEKVASGIYLYRLTAGEITTSKKMSLLK